jgi:hypothetical protein
MLSNVISKAIRTAGQTLDKFGRTFEVNPVVERCNNNLSTNDFAA